MDATLWARAKAEMHEEFYRLIIEGVGCGPFDGGCIAVARAMQKVVGGEIVVLMKADGRADHAAVFTNGVLVDFDGPLEPAEFLRRFNRNEQASTVEFRGIEASDLPAAHRSPELEQQLADLIAATLARFDDELVHHRHAPS